MPWSSRRIFCTQVAGLVQQLREKVGLQEAEWLRALKRAELEKILAAQQSGTPFHEIEQQLAKLQQQSPRPPQSKPADAIGAADLGKIIDATKALQRGDERQYSPYMSELLLKLLKREAWHTRPRAYVLSVVESGWLSVSSASNLLNTYFYLTHGAFVLGLVWRARAQFSPHWGVYEIGVLSPILRVLGRQDQELS
jgi:hypothetical protein